MFRKILVATDLTELSAPALSEAFDLAANVGAAVCVLHVADRPHDPSSHWGGALFQDDVKDYAGAAQQGQKDARDHLDQQVKDVLGGRTLSSLELVVKSGRPPEAILHAAQERGCDLVVVGTRGREATLGAVAERVVRLSHQRAVLVVPAHDAAHH